MAKRIVGDLAVRVGANVGALGIGMKKGAAHVRGFSRSAQREGRAIARSMVRVGLAAGAMAAGIGAATRRSITSLDAIGKRAAIIGLTAESLQELQFAAESSGVGITKLDTSLERFSKRLGEANQGFGAAKVQLEALNLTASELTEMGLDEAFAVVGQKISEMVDPTQRAATAAGLFGREGVAMVNMLKDGAAGLDEFRRRAREAGAVIDNETIKAAEDLEDQLGTTTLALRRQFGAALVELGPFLLRFAELATAAATAVSSIGDAIADLKAFGKPAMDALLDRESGGAGAAPSFSEETAKALLRADAMSDNLRNSAGTNTTTIVDMVTGEFVSIEEGARREKLRTEAANKQANQFQLFRRMQKKIIADFKPLGDGSEGGGGGGGGGGFNPLVPTKEDFEFMRDQFATQREIQLAEYETQLEELRAFRNAKLATEQELNALEERVHKDHQDRMADIDERARRVRLQGIQGMLGDFASLLSSGNKRIFAIGKAAAIAKSIVTGYEAAVTAWNDGMSKGGPARAAIQTAGSLAKTGALIAQIKSQSASSGGSQANVGGDGGAGSNSVAAGEAVTTRQVDVTFRQATGGSFMTPADARRMVAALNEALGEGANLRTNFG